MFEMKKRTHFAGRNMTFLAGCGLLLLLMSFHARAETVSCGGGVEITLSGVEAVQGSALLAEVRAPRSLAGLRGRWRDRNLFFWVTEDAHTYQTLIGVDLNQPPESLPLTLTSDSPGGESFVCETLIHVRKGSYTVERLTIDPKFLQLSEEDLARHNREARRLRGFWATATPEKLWAGEFRIPLEARRISGNFGRPRVLNGESRSPHSGEDFPADRGTPVRAAQRGRVVMALDLFFSGNTVVLDHGLGLYTLYAHLDSMSVKEGDFLDGDQLLGRVGSTGRVTGSHLHWSVRLNGARVNPLDLVKLFSSQPPVRESE